MPAKPSIRRLLFLALLVAEPAASDLSGYAVLTSDYVYRGVTYSDGHVAAQLGLDWSFENGFYAGVWGSTIDIQSGPGRSRDRQVNYYAGYAYPLNERWTIGGHVVAYRFPAQTGSVDYSYDEITASINYMDRIWAEYSYIPDLYRTDRHAHNLSLYGEWPITGSTIFGAGVGYYDPSEVTGDGYAYWQAGLSRSFDRLTFDLRFHDTSRWVRFVSSPERAGARVSLSARLQF